MRIGFDAKRAFLNSSGLGNYSRTLLRSLEQRYPANEYILYTPQTAQGEFLDFTRSSRSVRVREPESFFDKKFRSRWRSFGITSMLREDRVDVYHGLSNELPFNISEFKGKKIVTIHDLIFLRHPELYPYLDRKIYNKKFRHACDAADVIVSVSEETKKHIGQHYFIPDNKIQVIYQSCDARFRQDISAQTVADVLARHQLPKEYLLYVGTIEERKNLLTIVRALESVKDIPLVVVGSKRGYFEKVKACIAEHKLESRVYFPENVSNEDLPAIYHGASVFIFPSFFEGFGIPIIEALSTGVPVITTRGGLFPEAGGPGSVYINPTDHLELADKLKELLASSTLRRSIAQQGKEYVRRFHPDTIAIQLMELYNK